MTVYEKLKVVQQKLIAPKNQYNSFGKYNYRNCEDILEGAKSILNETNSVIVISDELVQVGERYYIQAKARFIDCDTGESIENTSYAREEENKKGMDSSQVTGATSSYARKYALNGLLCIDDVKDADSRDNTVKNDQKTADDQIIDAIKIKVIKKELERTGIREKVILNTYKITKLEDMKTSQFTDAMTKFEATPSK